MTVGNVRCTSYRTSFVVYFSRYNFYTRFFTRREASVRYQVMSRSDRPAPPPSQSCSTSPRTEFAWAAKRGLSPSFFSFFPHTKILRICTYSGCISTKFFYFLLFSCYFLAKTHISYTFLQHGDRREPVQPCAEPILCVIIPGWGGVYPFTKPDYRLLHYLDTC